MLTYNQTHHYEVSEDELKNLLVHVAEKYAWQ